MANIIVGSLLAIIIIAAGWLIFFYNMMLNKKTLIDDDWRLLNMLVSKRNEENYSCFELSSEWDAKIDEYSNLYNSKVNEYNESLNKFPNNIAASILDMREISPRQINDIF